MTIVKTITTDYVDALIDFEPTESIKNAGIGKLQKTGAAALFNMLVRNGVAYLADEVGMGKTYIGLAVMSLLRHQKPDARVLIITPRRNIQEKWSSDLSSFVRMNWRHADHRVKTPQGSPDWPVHLPDRLSDWVREVHECAPHDTILRMSSFSLGVDKINTEKEIERFCRKIPTKLQDKFANVLKEKSQEAFIDAVRDALSVGPYDLIIVDEAHNLKHGYTPGQPSSIRNESLYNLFAQTVQQTSSKPWLLMLSATPMENGDPRSLVRQFECFGRSNDALRSMGGDYDDTCIASMAGSIPRESLRNIQRRLIVRRVGELRLRDNSRYTRNMYRREWRLGGVDTPYCPMSPSSMTERLVNAVIQKNVFELIQSQSGGRFRIGALESFEIYSGASSAVTESDENSASQGQVLPDQRLIADLCASYRTTFAREVPHPKLNSVSRMLARQIKNREKVLVFVRRVATTTDLASRASQAFDEQILGMMSESLAPESRRYVERLREDWFQKRANRDFVDVREDDDDEDASADPKTLNKTEKKQIKDIVPSLFSWFFRGERDGLKDEGYSNWITGRHVRKMLGTGNRFCLLLEENYVDWALSRPKDVVTKLAKDSGLSKSEVLVSISRRVPASLYRADNYRRGFHAVQYAVLLWMREQSCYAYLDDKLKILIDEIFDQPASWGGEVTTVQVRIIQDYLSLRSVYPALARCGRDTNLSAIVARGVFEDTAEAATVDFRNTLRRREQIRHIQMASLRHGAPVVDLYCAFLVVRGGSVVVDGEHTLPVDDVAKEIVARWSQLQDDQWRASGAWELAELNTNFDLIRKLNLPDLDTIRDHVRPLDTVFIDGREPASDGSGEMRSVRRLLNQEMGGQSPTTAAMGGQDDQRRHRITTQFRMPGMPWVVVATNVYEEGVDLHTYCKTVVHHGISHTASSVEQRTGRVDRIGGQLQRDIATINGKEDFTDDKKIQSLFPYQNETFEKFQVRRVLANCNRFLESLHEGACGHEEDKEMNINDRHELPLQITGLLTSPFDVQSSPWIMGELDKPDRSTEFNSKAYIEEFQRFEGMLKNSFAGIKDSGAQGLERHYDLGHLKILITPRSHRKGDWLLMDVRVDNKKTNEHDFVDIKSHSSGGQWAQAVFACVEDLVFNVH